MSTDVTQFPDGDDGARARLNNNNIFDIDRRKKERTTKYN